MLEAKVKDLDQLVAEVDYAFLNEHYIPSTNAVEFITFIKLVNGGEGEEHASPVMHLHMIDEACKDKSSLFVAARGTAKTSVLHEYAFLYIATYGEFFDFGKVEVAMYVSDTMENGVKSMRKNLEFRYLNSEFLQKYVPEASFTDVRWEFKNADGHRFCVRGFGASTGVRGFKEYGKRPTWCGFDDLLSDKNAESATIIGMIKKIVYKAARAAMHPSKRKILWTGTPFNKRDPLYEAASSGGWNTNVYPICEKFPCSREDFRGAWEARFDYDFVKKEYYELLESNEVQAFNQEMMLRITSEEDRLVHDSDIRWYSRKDLIANKGAFNFYITTDFATSATESADFSVIAVWALSSAGGWFLVDGVCRRQGMGENVDDLFRMCQTYKPQLVGVEVSGQQGGFIPWLQAEQMKRNIWFTFASDGNNNLPGIRPNTGKFVRFGTVVPWFKQGLIHFPEDYRGKHQLVDECVEEVSLVTFTGFKSKNDDALDVISMLSVLKVWKPSEAIPMAQNTEGVYEVDDDEDEGCGMSNYVV